MVNWRFFAFVFLSTGCGGARFDAFGAAPTTTDGRVVDSTEDGGLGGASTASGGASTVDDDAGSGGSSGGRKSEGSGGSRAGNGGEAEVGGDAGLRAADAGAPECVTDLSGVGAGDFRISFTLTTTAHADVALLSQRIGCDQSSVLWGVSLNYNGQIAAATSDGSHWAATVGANSIADGKPHEIVFARTYGKIWISRDGAVDSIPVDDSYPLGALPPLRIGTDDCPNFWSAQRAGAILSNVCISRS
jgi:hypothetical protein